MINPWTERIPPDMWEDYFDNANRSFRSWRMTIEVLRADRGDQLVAEDVPLLLLGIETKGSEDGSVLVDALELRSIFMLHRIDRPRRLWISDIEPGASSALLIESRDGTMTLVSLRSPLALPPH